MIDWQPLIARATAALAHAHAPYSGYRVGAALLTADGRIFTGVNVENASYGLTLCAERVAVGAAVAAGARAFRAIAIVSDGAAVPMPCGACRQVLAEFGDAGFLVAAATRHAPERLQTDTLGRLLPNAFVLEPAEAPRRAARRQGEPDTDR